MTKQNPLLLKARLSKKELESLTRPELSIVCRNSLIKGFAGKTKEERVKLILKHYNSLGHAEKYKRKLAEFSGISYKEWLQQKKDFKKKR
jgi:hypothetical protein